jgi:hypothetical protein
LCGNVNACSGRGLFTQVDRRGKARRHVWRYFAPAQLLNGSTDRLVESRNRAGVAGNHGSRDRGRSRRCAMRAVAPVAGAVAKRNRKPAFVGARIGDGRARGRKRSHALPPRPSIAIRIAAAVRLRSRRNSSLSPRLSSRSRDPPTIPGGFVVWRARPLARSHTGRCCFAIHAKACALSCERA